MSRLEKFRDAFVLLGLLVLGFTDVLICVAIMAYRLINPERILTSHVFVLVILLIIGGVMIILGAAAERSEKKES